MISEPIAHEYFNPGGPLTYEYPLDCPIPENHLTQLSRFVRQFYESKPCEITNSLLHRWRFVSEIVKPLRDEILSMLPTSIAVQECSDSNPVQSSWIVFRDQVGGSFLSDLYLIGESPARSQEINKATWIRSIDGLNDIVEHFGNLNLCEIPSCTGFGIGDRLVHESDEQLCWGETGNWENALPIYSTGAGDIVCVSTFGTIGLWTVEKFVEIAPDLSSFIQLFLTQQRSKTRLEWWW